MPANAVFIHEPLPPRRWGAVDVSGERQIGLAAVGRRDAYHFVADMVAHGFLWLNPINDPSGKTVTIGTNREAAIYYGRLYKCAKALAQRSALRCGATRRVARPWYAFLPELRDKTWLMTDGEMIDYLRRQRSASS
jgi:hypothetical protein